MDIFAHGLWTGALYKGVNRKVAKPFKVWQAVFWGVFPDLFAFAVPLAGLIWNWTFDGLNFSDFPDPSKTEPPPPDTLWFFRLASFLYSISHSLVIFVLVFGFIWLIRKQPVWELGGWLLHILIDIPTHSYNFYPTPAFWPVSYWKFNGFSWGTPWFMIVNYSALVFVYFLLRKKKKTAK